MTWRNLATPAERVLLLAAALGLAVALGWQLFSERQPDALPATAGRPSPAGAAMHP